MTDRQKQQLSYHAMRSFKLKMRKNWVSVRTPLGELMALPNLYPLVGWVWRHLLPYFLHPSRQQASTTVYTGRHLQH